MIDDSDCDTEYPEPVDDEYIADNEVPQDGQPTPLLATIHIVRSVQTLVRLFKSECISPEAINSFGKHLDACHSLFPPPLLLSSKAPLDCRSVAPIIYLQNVRMMLYRHNLSPFCKHEARHRAVDACVDIALNTSHVMSRCLGRTPATRNDLAVSATTLLCTHLWRSTLFLVFRGKYEQASTLVHALSTIGSARSVTIDCGRHIAFFIKCIVDRLQSGLPGDFEQDEELMAYVSADMQSSAENSWVWQGSETGANLSAESNLHQGRINVSNGNGGPGWPPFARADLRQIPYDRVLVEETPRDWNGWEEVERSLRDLWEQQDRQRQKQRQQTQFRESYHPQAAATPPRLQPPRQPQVPVSSGNSTMTIANIVMN
jgi:hypothetical protein